MLPPHGAWVTEAINNMADKIEKAVCTFSFKKRGRVKNTRKRKTSDDEGLLIKTKTKLKLTLQ